MKQVLYTCTRCKKQVTVEAGATDPRILKTESLPMEWAEIYYRRVHTVVQGDQQQTLQTVSTTHACGDCAKAVLDFIESQG